MTAPYLDTHTAIVGASGAGKTVTAKDHVELLLEAGRHVCVLDPTGAWWGMRSDAAGEGEGFPIPIFGGAHGDVQITAEQGSVIGKIVADGVSAIVDISALRTGAEQRRFARDLARALRAKPDGNFHFVIDEADEFAAQKPRDDYGFQVGEELIWMAKRGRLAGFVLTLITQRPASIDKEVLTQAQTLIIHQLVAPVDQKPIVDYLKDHADRQTLAAIKGSLAGLDRGERWIYAPRLGLLERGVSPMPRTFDSSRTPEPGESVQEPKMLAQIDLGAIKELLAPPAVESESADVGEAMKRPEWGAEVKWLRDRVADLETERDSLSGIIERKNDQIDRTEAELEEVKAEVDRLHGVVAAYQRGIEAQMAIIGDISWPSIPRRDGSMPHEPLVIPPVVQAPTADPTSPQRQEQPKRIARPEPRPASPVNSGGTAGETAPIPSGCAKPLAALAAMYPGSLTEGQWAATAGYKKSGGTWKEYVRRLIRAGMVVKTGDGYVATKLGAASSGPVELPPAPGPALARWWAGKISGAPKLVEALLAGPLVGMSKQALADAVHMEANGGSFKEYVRRLARQNVVTVEGEIVRLASEVMGK